MELFSCTWRSFKNAIKIPIDHNKQPFLSWRAYLRKFGDFGGSLDKFAVGLVSRALTGRAPHPTGRTPLTGRARWKITLPKWAWWFPRLWRVAPVVFSHCGRPSDGSRAPGLTGRAPVQCPNSLSIRSFLSITLSNLSCKRLGCTMRVIGGNLGFYKFHLKKFHSQTHFLMFSLWHFITLTFWFLLSWIWLIECFDLILFAGRSSEGSWQGDQGCILFAEDFWNFITYLQKLRKWPWL